MLCGCRKIIARLGAKVITIEHAQNTLGMEEAVKLFGTAGSLFDIARLILSLGSGIINLDFEDFSLTVNLAMFYAIAVLLAWWGSQGRCCAS
jgi:hypothetical protein